MFNDTTSLAAYLPSRRSGKPRDMIAPGPSDDQLHDIIATALRTPDHGKLAPWRIVIIGSMQRTAFAETLKAAYRAEFSAEGVDLSALDQFAHEAPTLLAVISAPQREAKIPLWEQQLSAGALCMNLLHAAHAAGFVGSWLTGWAAYNRHVVTALGAGDGDTLAGYLFFGTAGKELQERPRPVYDDVVRRWDI